MATILVVDDELGIRALLSEILTDEGHTVELAEDAAQARLVRESLRPDLVLLDIWMPDVDGITLLKEWSASAQLTMPVIMMSGHGTIDTAVEATKHGASAFLEKPITLQKLLRAVEQALAKPSQRSSCPRCPAWARTVAWAAKPWPPAMPPTRPDCSRRPGPVPSRASTSTGRCGRPATRSSGPTSNSTSPRKMAR
jgi:DNA-binding NtrC family response regulator